MSLEYEQVEAVIVGVQTDDKGEGWLVFAPYSPDMDLYSRDYMGYRITQEGRFQVHKYRMKLLQDEYKSGTIWHSFSRDSSSSTSWSKRHNDK